MGIFQKIFGGKTQLIAPVAASSTQPDLTQLRNDVATCMPIFELLTTQIRDISTEIESKVVSTCSSFSAIINRTRDVVSAASASLEGTDGEMGGDELVSATREVLSDLLTRLDESSDFSIETAAKIQDVETKLEVVNHSLSGVNEISEVAKVVALNGRIEAARAGQHGKAFSVVAKETGELADKAMKTSQEVRRTVEQLSDVLNQTSSRMQNQRELDTQRSARFRQLVGEILQKLLAHNDYLKDSLQQLSDSGETVASEVSNAIVALQFQDAVSQRVEHVLEMLSGIHEILDPLAAGANVAAVDQRVRQWKEKISVQYTMQAERAIHDPSVSDDDFETDIELF